MHIRELRKAELEAFVMSEEYTRMEYVPVSRHRAISQVRNPRARDEDILLLVAYENDEMMGYLGLLPDDFDTKKGSFHFAWMSTIWVHSEARGKGVARALLDAAMRVYKNRVMGTDFTAEARAIYLRTGHFDLFQKYEGIRLYYRFNLRELLPPKRRIYARIKPLLALADSLLNFLKGILPKRSKTLAEFTVHEVKEWTGDHDEFIGRFEWPSPTGRMSADLNWIIQNPWILEAGQADDLGRRYHFTSARKRAHFECREIRRDGKCVALLLLSVQGNALKVPYAFYEREVEDAVCAFIDRLMIEKKLSTLTVFHPRLRAALASASTAAFLKRTIIREYVSGIPFHEEISRGASGHFQDGDGDCAFT